jgi:hypothetical protein
LESEALLNVKQAAILPKFNYILVNNTNHTYKYYNFNSDYSNCNIYSDLMLTSFSSGKTNWRAHYNYNARLATDEFENELEERTEFLPSLSTIRRGSIANFFTTNMIYIPRCLKKSYSIYKPIFELTHLKFLNILMRHGKKEQIFSTVFKDFVFNRLHNKFTRGEPQTSLDWVSLLPVLTTTSLTADSIYQTFHFMKLRLCMLDKTIDSGYLTHPQSRQLSTFFTSHLEKYKSVFMFKVQKVDKRTRKNSRGKSGKYLVLWKYVPVYRRIYTVLRWLIQDISFQKSYKFQTRFSRAVDLILNDPKKSIMYKCRNFNHNFVFKNFKKTLLKNLKTVS